jgi:hypothetical protein
MNKNHPTHMGTVITSFALIALACNLITVAESPTQAPFELPTGIPPQTVAAPPTNPPEPTAENTSAPLPSPDVPTTEATSQAMADVQNYYEKGYLPFQNGQMYFLDDFSKPRPSNTVFDFTRTGQQSQDFALWADIELNSVGSTTYPNYAGCGFAYRVQNNSDGYTAMLTNEAVRMGYCTSGLRQCELFGTTFGTGIVEVRNKTTAHFALAVNKDRAFVFVDDILVGQYTLFTTKLLGIGDLYYGVVSNVNAGYSTSCQISNVQLWESTP